MSPRVTYWTGVWDPAKEAISKEVNALRVGPRRLSPVVAFSPGQSSKLLVGQRVCRLSSDRWLLVRALARLLEPRGDVTHIFGGHHSWHYLRSLGRRPIILTAVSHAPEKGSLDVSRLSRVVIEHEAARQDWIAAGVAADRIDLIRPGIDLEHFSMAEAPASGPFRLLFASSPSEVGEIEPRGIGLLIELARLRPDVEILVPWRIWGDVSAALRAVEAMSPPSNFVVRPGDVADMRAIYATSHATVACFDQGVGKTCPNFVLEGLAVGRPCLVTSSVGVADVIAQTGGGVVVSRDAQALARGADQLQQNWQAYSGRARHTARDHYDLEMFRRSYQALYERTAAGRAA